MTWEEWAAIGHRVGGVAVTISLVDVGLQIRQSADAIPFYPGDGSLSLANLPRRRSPRLSGVSVGRS